MPNSGWPRGAGSVTLRAFFRSTGGTRVMPRIAPLSIAVIGGGLGGLTAAVALHQAGFDVHVYEQAPELTEVGGGINMGPNAARVLYRLGLGEALGRGAGAPPRTPPPPWPRGR